LLVLTRKKGEKIVIGDNIFVTVLEVRGDQIQLGIDAPRAITVHREEVFREIQEENIKARRASTVELQQVQKLLGARKTEGEEEGEGEGD